MADRTKGVLLDSSVVIAYLRGRLDLRQNVAPDEPLFLPLVALGELYKGALKSQRPAENLARISELTAVLAVLNPDGGRAGAERRTHPGERPLDCGDGAGMRYAARHA